MRDEPWRPRLRDGVTILRWADGKVALRDPIFNRLVDQSGAARAVVERLDGRRTVDDVLAEAAAADPAAPPGAAERAFRRLLLLDLVEGAGAATCERARGIRSGETRFDVVTLPGDRFECQGSGDCCRGNFAFGPLLDEDVARIEALEPARHFPRLGGEPFYREVKSSLIASGRYLRTVDGTCVFLEPGERCGLHARFGPETKPDFCRRFPFSKILTVEGFLAYNAGGCATYAVSSRAGRPTIEQLPDIAPAMPSGLELYHPIVLLEGGERCDYGWFVPLRAALLEIAERQAGTAAETLGAIARASRAYFDALLACPLAPGEPDATVARALDALPAAAAAAAPPAAADVARGTQALVALLDEILAALEAEIGRAPPGVNANTIRLPSDLAAVLRFAREVVAHRADPAGRPLPAPVRAIAAIPADDPEIDALLRLSFRQQLFGFGALVADRPAAGLLRLALTTVATLYGARLQASLAGAPRARPADTSFGHMRAVRMFRLPALEEIFAARAESAWEVCQALPAVV